MERRKVEGDENESKMGEEEEEYSCSLYFVSSEFELLELKAKTALRSEGAVTSSWQSHPTSSAIESRKLYTLSKCAIFYCS
jgi:hypothetical protein